MKNKIVIGLGLMFSLTSGLTFAGDASPLSVSHEEIIKGAPANIDTSALVFDSLHHYYDISCTVNNIHDVDDILMFASIHSHGSKHNMGPVFLNGKQINIINNHIEASLNHGINTIVFMNYYIGDNSAGSYIQVEAKNGNKKTNPFGTFGFYLQECQYAPSNVQTTTTF